MTAWRHNPAPSLLLNAMAYAHSRTVFASMMQYRLTTHAYRHKRHSVQKKMPSHDSRLIKILKSTLHPSLAMADILTLLIVLCFACRIMLFIWAACRSILPPTCKIEMESHYNMLIVSHFHDHFRYEKYWYYEIIWAYSWHRYKLSALFHQCLPPLAHRGLATIISL